MSGNRINPIVMSRGSLRFAVMSFVVVLLASGVCVLAATLAASKPIRLDMTATRQHSLSDRTAGLLDGLTGRHEIVVVADLRTVSPTVWQRVLDVLGEFDRASSLLTVTVIDASGADGVRDLTRLLNRLGEMYAGPLADQIEALQQISGVAERVASGSTSLSDDLLAARDAIDASLVQREQLEDLAAIARLRASDLSRSAIDARTSMRETVAGSSVPLLDNARQSLGEPLSLVRDELAALTESLEQFAEALRANEMAGLAETTAAANRARSLRDDAARASDQLTRLENLRIIPVARALAETNAVVVLSETEATAVQFDALVPTQALIDEMGGVTADVRFIGEELLSTAIGAVARDDQPVVVLTHAGDERLLDASGQPAVRRGPFQARALVDRLRLRGMMVLEWAVALDEQAPVIDHIEEIGDRPVVWAIVGSVALGAQSTANLPALQAAVEQLIAAGESVLLSTAPSTLAGIGEPDPLTAPLSAFGITADTGRPLLRRVPTADGGVVSAATIALRGSDHPIGRAVNGLSTLLPWAIAIEIDDVEGAWPIMVIDETDQTWGESQWIEFWSMPQSQRDRLQNPPAPTQGRDAVGGPWVVAAGGERVHPSGAGLQRTVIVGGTGWFFDVYTQGYTTIDGRTVLTSPGNLELFEASIYWLAEQEDLVGTSARAADTPRIAPLQSAQLTALRWALGAGLPVIVLAVGVSLRLYRG